MELPWYLPHNQKTAPEAVARWAIIDKGLGPSSRGNHGVYDGVGRRHGLLNADPSIDGHRSECLDRRAMVGRGKEKS